MHRWLCCNCQMDEPCHEHQNEYLKSPSNNIDGNLKDPKTSAGVKSEQQKAPPPIEVPSLALEELKEKTDNFGSKALIGEGSYGRVYYVVLNNGKHVAVKKLDVTSEPESNTEFLTQVSIVSRLKHENLVEMLGYCVEGNLRISAYEFATMGSLHDILHGYEQVWEGEEHAIGQRYCCFLYSVTGASRGYAFVEYESDREMCRAYEDAHHSIIDDSEVIVDYYRQHLMPGWIPRRLGGGLGGKKESGQLRFGGRERPFRAPLRPIP